MARILKLSWLYFCLIFGAGFVLGPMRVLFLEPRLGERTAQLLEMPVMLLVIWLAAGWLIQRSAQNLSSKGLLGFGLLAVSYVLVADVGVGVGLRSMTIAEVFLNRDPVAGSAYYGLLVLAAIMPWLRVHHNGA